MKGASGGMEQVLKRIENLLTVKSIVTLALTAVFAWQAVKGEVSQDFMMIYTTERRLVLMEDKQDGHRLLFRHPGAEAAQRGGCEA